MSLLGSGRENRVLRQAFAHCVETIDNLAVESGMSPTRARNLAEDWVARLQGALILQAATGDTGPSKRAIAALLDLPKEDTKHAQR